MTLEAWRTPELRDLLGKEAAEISISRGWRALSAWDALVATIRPGSLGRQATYVRRRATALGHRVLVTQIDNYDFLAALASALVSTRIVAIQNGVRLDHELDTLRASLRGAADRSGRLLHDVFLCWGQSDVDRLAHFGLAARSALPIGSLRDSLHRAAPARPPSQSELAVVLIKPKTFAPTTDTYRRNQGASRAAVLAYLSRYAHGADITPAMVLVPGPQSRLEVQRSLVERHYSGPWSTMTSGDRLSSYDGVMGARVTLGDQSSLLVEALGRGRRILSVNMTDDPSLDFPVAGPWAMKKPSYEEFAERLTWIREMSDADWAAVIGSVPRYLVNYNPEYPTHVFIKDLISAIAEDRPWPQVTW